MTINLGLSTESILNAIARLRTVNENIRWGVSELVDTLASEGGQVAYDSYQGMATAVGFGESETEGHIYATGEAVGFAEFGAGDTTMESEFENPAPFDVYPGSWSEQEGSGEYAETGMWHFGGRRYTYVYPRHGLLDAKRFIEQHSSEYGQELIRL